MSWTLKPVTDRVARMRAAYRDTVPEVCTARYRIITDRGEFVVDAYSPSDAARRVTRDISPVTREPQKPGAYDRAKTRAWDRDDPRFGLCSAFSYRSRTSASGY